MCHTASLLQSDVKISYIFTLKNRDSNRFKPVCHAQQSSQGGLLFLNVQSKSASDHSGSAFYRGVVNL